MRYGQSRLGNHLNVGPVNSRDNGANNAVATGDYGAGRGTLVSVAPPISPLHLRIGAACTRVTAGHALTKPARGLRHTSLVAESCAAAAAVAGALPPLFPATFAGGADAGTVAAPFHTTFRSLLVGACAGERTNEVANQRFMGNRAVHCSSTR